MSPFPSKFTEKLNLNPQKQAGRAETCRNQSSTLALRILRSAKVPSYIWEFNAEFRLEGSSKKSQLSVFAAITASVLCEAVSGHDRDRFASDYLLLYPPGLFITLPKRTYNRFLPIFFQTGKMKTWKVTNSVLAGSPFRGTVWLV